MEEEFKPTDTSVCPKKLPCLAKKKKKESVFDKEDMIHSSDVKECFEKIKWA